MNENKRRFIKKCMRQTKKNLVDMICELYEENFYKTKKIEKLNSLVFSHQQVIGSILDSRNIKFIYETHEIEEDSEESEYNKKELIKSYA